MSTLTELRHLTVRAAEVVLPCSHLGATLDFFIDRLGFRLDVIMPADDPAIAVLSGHGLRIRLERGTTGDPGELRLACDNPRGGDSESLTAPNGTRILLVDATPPLVVPDSAPVFELTHAQGDDGGVGRAGMHYRDLLPQRQGGRFIASHIQIPEAGPVPDYVHHHRVRFQMIYCAAGWVRVVYEDQGPSFVLEAGDCVLQPPGIRHRVLESSTGLEVIEIGCPADHETTSDHDMMLPTAALRPDRSFAGQRFVRHHGAEALWGPWRLAGFECRDTGIGAATQGLAGACVLRTPRDLAPATDVTNAEASVHDGELLFWYVLSGQVTLLCCGRSNETLGKGDAVAIPAGVAHRLVAGSADLELLEVTLPADLQVRSVPAGSPDG